METEETPVPRRPTRRFALSEVNESGGTPTKNSSPEERVIIQRGRRCKPITWSPLDFNRNQILQKSADKTPEKLISRTELISSRLKRRLILSPTKPKLQPDELGSYIAKKLGMMTKKGEEFFSHSNEKDVLQNEEMKGEMSD